MLHRPRVMRLDTMSKVDLKVSFCPFPKMKKYYEKPIFTFFFPS